MPNIESGMRARLAEILPDAFATALSSYHIFLTEENDARKTPKGFKEHHDACKVAIAHLELLLDLAQKADLPDEDETGESALSILIDNAKAELGNKQPETENNA